MRRYVLLDRDGTINIDRDYLADPDLVELMPGAAEGLRRLASRGLGLVVITNQSGVARGLIRPEQLEIVHHRLVELLAAEGIELAGIYACPHGPDEACRCRKPAVGLVEQAARELGFDPRQAFVVGDKASDIELGQRLAATTVLVRTGYGAATEQARRIEPDYVVDDLLAAAELIQSLADAGADQSSS